MSDVMLRDRFRILETVGRGGQGEVHRAVDLLHERQVAVKVRRLVPGMPVDHILSEARVLFSLTPHASLAVAREDHIGDDAYMLVMDWVEGASLADRLADGPVPYIEAIEILRAIAAALDHLHAHVPPVVHGDVKPGNVILSPERGPVLVDFGLATAGMYGTPQYQAPESAVAARAPAMDLYSLAATAHASLEGGPPVPGHVPMLPTVPDALRVRVLDALRRGLANDPDARPVSAAELVASLAPPSTPTNLPSPVSRFIGRPHEIRSIAALLGDDRLVTLVGPAGVGKTRLATEVATRHLHRFPDGAWWTDLAPVADPARTADTIAMALPGGAVADDPLEQMGDRIGDADVLLICDNAEHVLADCGRAVTKLLERCPQLRVLVTSRERLGVPGEAVWDVDPLPVPDADAEPWAIEDTDSVRLFCDRSRPRLEPTADDWPLVGAICRMLDGLPLAVEMAAARAGTIGLRALSDGLSDRFDMLRSGPSSPERHRSLAAAIDWSYKQLATEEQECFRRLSAFPGTFSVEGARALCAPGTIDQRGVSRSVEHLVECSLIAHAGERYRMLASIRAFAAEQLAERGEHDETMERLADWIAEVARDVEDARLPQQEWLARLAPEEGTTRRALEWSLERGTFDRALRIYIPLGMTLHTSTTEVRTIAATLLASASGPARRLAHLAEIAAGFEQIAGDDAAAQVALERALELYRSAGDVNGEVSALRRLGALAASTNDPDGCAQRYDEAMDIARRAGDGRALGEALTGFGSLALDRGEYAEAVDLLSEALGHLHAHKLNTSTALGLLSHAYASQEMWDDAARYAEELVALWQDSGDPNGRLAGAMTLAQANLRRGKIRESVDLLRTALAEARDAGMRLHAIGALWTVAELLAEVGPAESGTRLLAAAHALDSGGHGPDDEHAAYCLRVLEPLRRALGPDAFDHAWSAGLAMPLDDAIALALRELDTVPTT